MKRRRSFAFSDNHRRILNHVVSRLNISQKQVADECGISQSWLSQLLNGKRTGAEADQVFKIREGLVRLLGEHGGGDKEELARSVQEMFSMSIIAEQATNESVAALRVAADVMDVLLSRCPTKSMRRQVVEILKTAIEQ